MHQDHLSGSFLGPSNLVDLLRHRAARQTHMRAFTYLVDGETEEINITYGELDRQARAVARRLKAALELVDIRLLDHLIIGDGRATSLAARGLI